VAKYEYDTWGMVRSVKDANNANITDQNHVGNLNPFRYRGYYYDKETQLYYLLSRYYDPVTHRFLNADGYFQSGGGLLDANMNAYCGNNPVNRFDPSGTCWIPVYSTCGAQMGSYWSTVRPVPGASYYCSKCGGCDPAVYPNAPTGTSTPSGSTGGSSSSSGLLDVTEAVNKAVRNDVATFEAHYLDFLWFMDQVDHKKPWDIKRKDPWEDKIGIPYPGDSKTEVIWDGEVVTPEILGNMTYGYLGRKAGFDIMTLLAGGDFAAGGIWGVITRSDTFEDKVAIFKGYCISTWYGGKHMKPILKKY